MVRNSPAKAKADQASQRSDDKSRSAKAFRAGATLKAGGASYEEMRDGLLQHEDPEIADWANSKGLRQQRTRTQGIYDKAWAQGSIVKVGGVEKRLVP